MEGLMTEGLAYEPEDDDILRPWRRVGRAVFAQQDKRHQAETDDLIGVMATPKLADEVCEAHNKVLEGRY
jgi:hypothetical protein